MCGILGGFSSNTNFKSFQESDESKTFKNALNVAAHRGPDGIGTWNHKGQNYSLCFGHRRLSIIDLSTEANQPMLVGTRDNPNEKYSIIFNGEIYNYIEIKEELVAMGVKFHTVSDTEVIVRAYEKWKDRAFNKFNGMWAIAIWDPTEQKLILSRDRMGVKPLYYTFVESTLLFASEIKQLLNYRESLGIKNSWNPYSMYEFLANAKLHHTDETMYKEIYAFPKASFVSIHSKELDLKVFENKIQRYWTLPTQIKELSYLQAANELKELLYSSVKFRLRSDVAVGSALSGGIDSSSIVSILAKLNPLEQKTFSASFPVVDIDERKYAEMVVRGTQIKPTFVEPTAEMLIDDFEKLIWHQDGPVVSTSMFAQWKVFQAARENKVTVMLDGQGADELFAGYEGFWQQMVKSSFLNLNPIEAALQISQFVKNHPKYFLNIKRLQSKRQKQYPWIKLFNSHAQDEVATRLHNLQYEDEGKAKTIFNDPLKQALFQATFETSLPSLLHYEDRNSMAFSIESRTPFLDYRIVEFAFSLPAKYLVKEGVRKSILRESVKGLIPEVIRTRNDKIGFATPESKWSKKVYPTLFKQYEKESPFMLLNKKETIKAYSSTKSFRIIAAMCAEKRMSV